MGPAKTKVWNSPFSPQGSTPGGRSRKKEASSSRPAKDLSSFFGSMQTVMARKPSSTNRRGQFTRVYFPDREKRGHVCAHKFLFTIDAQVFQENVAETEVMNSLFAKTKNRFGHARLVDRIRTLRRNADFFDRQANGFGLPVKEFVANAVHADALVALGYGGQEGDHFIVRITKKDVQGHCTVFPATPREHQWNSHGSVAAREGISQAHGVGLA